MSLGLFGGYPGCNVEYSQYRDANVEDVPESVDAIEAGEHEESSWGHVELGERDIQYVRFMGGGGYGDPIDRDAQAVLRDVLDGLVGEQAAREIYGVVVDVAAEAIDEDATGRRRLEIRAERLGREVDAKLATRREVPATRRRLGEYLQQADDGTQCTWCGHTLAPVGADWKERATLSRMPVSHAGPQRPDTGEFFLIRACCPECATLLDLDLARGDDPPLHDRVRSWPEG
jgi:N-methylhydantoinase B